MTRNVFTPSVDGEPMPWSARRRGVRPPSRHVIYEVLQWIDEAEAAQRTWAKNALAVISMIATLVWVAMRLGLLSE
ncbi:MAG: hypothetical protein ACYC0X_03720 [Pirellulaceae bacterium]